MMLIIGFVMPQHFLLSSRAKTLTLASVMRMIDEEVERVFIRLRWEDNKGEPYCPHCGCPTVWACRRPGRAPRWRCKACQKDFSITSGTLFAFHKLQDALLCGDQLARQLGSFRSQCGGSAIHIW
jgi:hypothetical protein